MLDRLMTRWFLRGDRVLCGSVAEAVNHIHGEGLLLQVDPSEAKPDDPALLVFLARKAIGYFFPKRPITAASVVVSLVQLTTDTMALKHLAHLILDPLLMNHPGKVKDYISQQTETLTGSAKETLNAALSALDKYLDDLRSMPEIRELQPPQSQREAYQRRFSRTMYEAVRKAEKDHALLSLFKRIHLLYGKRAVYHAHTPRDQLERLEVPLRSCETRIEVPRMMSIDPFGLEHMLRVFRAERIV